MKKQLTNAERREVERRQAEIAADKARDVSFEEALADWRANCADRWREERRLLALRKQREEIMRHKWIESEKAQRDLGAEAALDWIRKYAGQWRKWYEEEYDETEISGRSG
jgi:hypothetical protein